MRYLVAVAHYGELDTCCGWLRSRFREGADVFYPKISVVAKSRHRKSKKLVETVEPAFGLYFFLGLECEADWAISLQAKGISHLLLMDGQPVWCREKDILELKDRRFQRSEGWTPEGTKKAKVGDAVFISGDGPFAGIAGVKAGEGRIEIRWPNSVITVTIADSLLSPTE